MQKTELRNKLLSYLQNYQATKEAWESVKFVTKKDGKPFQRLSMNFVGASFGKYYPCEDAEHPYLTVSKYANGKYISDSIAAYYYLDELPDTDERKKAYKPQFLRQTTPKTLDEIKASINATIKKYEHYVQTTTKEIEMLESCYDRFITVATQLRNDIEKELDNRDSLSLYYGIKEIIKNLF